MTTKVVKREAVYISLDEMKIALRKKMQEALTFSFFAKEKVCQECEWYAERINDVCELCANFKGQYKLAPVVKVGEGKYLKVPRGSHKKMLRYLDNHNIDYRVLDKSPETKIKPFRFTGEFRNGQEEAIDAMLRRKRGVLCAPPRSGKTVMGTALTAKLQVKTLILASQRDWLMGFHESFVGSKTQDPLTTLKPSRIKLCKTLQDFRDHDVCLATVQTFYSPGGEQLLAKLRDMFSLILIDEVHSAAADKYAGITAKLNAKYMIGFSGTPDRKDNKYVLVDNIVGPILHEMKTERQRPRIKLTRTAYQPPGSKRRGPTPWAYIVSNMENDKKRIDVIARQAIADVKDGHMVLIPVAQVKPIKKIVDRINELAGRTLAYAFTGSLKKADRDSYIQRARDYKIKILVGTQKILSVGINIPRASCLYEVVLSSNMPNAQQRMARVLTPMPDKPESLIRYFLDDFPVRKSCMRAEYYQVMEPIFKPLISPRDKEMLLEYFRSKSATHDKFDL